MNHEKTLRDAQDLAVKLAEEIQRYFGNKKFIEPEEKDTLVAAMIMLNQAFFLTEDAEISEDAQ